MDLVAVIATDGAQFMDSPSKLKKLFLFLMTRKAGVSPGRCILSLERKDESLSFGLGVLLSGAMAGFASFPFRRHFWVKGIFPVGGAPFEALIKIRMAIFACLGPHITFLLDFFFLLTEGCHANEGYHA
jgi:hypothetical protein